MLRKIEELRQKPKHVRNRYALTYAVTLTAVVVVIWLVSVPSRFAGMEIAPVDDDNSGGVSRALDDVQGQFANAFKSIGDTWSQFEDLSATSTASTSIVFDLDEMIASSTNSQSVATTTEVVEYSTSTDLQVSTSTTEKDLETIDEPTYILIGTSSDEHY